MPSQDNDRSKLWSNFVRSQRVDVMVAGPPGSGKTSLAAALASGAGVSKSITPFRESAELIRAVYQGFKLADDSKLLTSSSTNMVHMQVAPSEDGDIRVATELAMLELGEEPLDVHSLRRAVCFAPTWILLLDPVCRRRQWFLDRLPIWSRELALPDGGQALPPASYGRDRQASVPQERLSRSIRQIIVLLTKVDEVVSKWLPSLVCRQFYGRLGVIGNDTDFEGIDRFVSRLDLEAWLSHYDSSFLHRVRDYLGGPQTEVFIGCVSSVGWRRPTEEHPEWCPFGTGQLLNLILNNEICTPFRRATFGQTSRRLLKISDPRP